MKLDPDANIVILTGAGISKESGLSTFRDADGIWATVRVEDVATPEAFTRDPARVHAFYNERRAGFLQSDITPNAAHLALARLEAEWAGKVTLVTQNIDNLHEQAGSKNLIHMHGELLKARCQACGLVTRWEGDMDGLSRCPNCSVQGKMRVHVVWFGEMPFDMDQIYLELAGCDLFISIGTSGNVYPAAGFVSEIRNARRGKTAELNLEPSEGGHLFDYTHYGKASEIVPQFVGDLLSLRS